MGHCLRPEFKYDQPDLENGVVLTVEPQVIATLPAFRYLDEDDRIWLTATVGWEATNGIPQVVFFIERHIDDVSTLAYSITDSQEAAYDRWGDSSLNYVDTNQVETVQYRLLAALGYDHKTGNPFGETTVYEATFTANLYPG